MKIRNGFVSNSSSSSFIIRGIEITDDIISKLNFTESELEIYNDTENDDYIYDVSNIVNKKLKSLDIKLDCEYEMIDEYNESEEQRRLFIGKCMKGDLGYGNVVEFTNKDIKSTDDNIVNEFSKIDINLDKDDIKIIIQYVENH